jgi:hypothetical protein
MFTAHHSTARYLVLCGLLAMPSSGARAEPPDLSQTRRDATDVPQAALATPAAPVMAAVKPVPPAITLTAKVDLAAQHMTVLVNGKARHQWAISSGRAEFPTPRGNFRPEWTAKMWYSKKYDDAPMPHAVFFKDGAAIHATSATGRLGQPASHGCVRLAPGNAAQFYALVQSHGLVHTRISVSGTPKYSAPAAVAQRRDIDDPARGVRPARMGYGNAYAAYPYQPAYRTTTPRAQVVYYSQSTNTGIFASSTYRLR